MMCSYCQAVSLNVCGMAPTLEYRSMRRREFREERLEVWRGKFN
jgi:hypothetical protein